MKPAEKQQPLRRPVQFLLILLTFCLLPAPALARKAWLEQVTLTNTRDHLVLYFDVKGAFTPRIKEAIRNGLPTTFTYHVGLYRIRDSWPDKRLMRRKLSSTVKYDVLKETFTVSRPWKTDAPQVTTGSLASAQALMTEVVNLPVERLDHLTSGRPYQIRIKAEMKKIRLPFFLHHVLFFLSLFDFDTDWYSLDFTL